MDLCKELGADLVINYTRDDFSEIVMAETQNAGVDVIFDNVGEAVMDKSMHCIAYNGRYLMMGFASDKTHADEKLIVPRRVSAGNFKLCGVLLAYAPATIAPLMKQGMGWNFASDELGKRMHEGIIDLVLKKRIKPVIGKVIDFEEIPAAIVAMANRETVGRTIVKLY
jgi:NADPH2:quinone reductase